AVGSPSLEGFQSGCGTWDGPVLGTVGLSAPTLTIPRFCGRKARPKASLLLFLSPGRGITAAPSPTRPRQWQMSVGVSEDSGLFSCSIWRPQGKSYLFFTQFKAEVKGAKIEHAMAYVSPTISIPLRQQSSSVHSPDLHGIPTHHSSTECNIGSRPPAPFLSLS
uniref:Uncharacterized protein n=1 Tax=Malurus cyaneus samueli TaxID=2593467 RepID=A0A8C5U4W9_9PASS